MRPRIVVVTTPLVADLFPLSKLPHHRCRLCVPSWNVVFVRHLSIDRDGPGLGERIGDRG